jgi:hypothetical protein
VPKLDASRSDEEQLHHGNLNDRQRCRARLATTESAMNQLVADFLASHGGAAVCPTAYAVLSRQYRV